MHLQNCLLKIQSWVSVLARMVVWEDGKQHTKSTHINFIKYFQVFLPRKREKVLQNAEKHWLHLGFFSYFIADIIVLVLPEAPYKLYLPFY